MDWGGHLALAQERVEDPYEMGLHAWDEGRYEDALEAFSRAYEATGDSLVLVNVGAAQVQLGRYAAAADTYRRLLEEDDPRVVEQAGMARRALEELQPLLANVTLRVQGLATDDQVFVDERELLRAPDAARMVTTLELDPGEHRAWVERDGRTIAEAELVVNGGDAREVLLVAPPADLTAGAAERAEASPTGAPSLDRVGMEDDAGTPLEQSRWFWGAVGVGAVAIAGSVIALLVTGGDVETYSGSFEPGQVRVR